jgi:hypothetical protein
VSYPADLTYRFAVLSNPIDFALFLSSLFSHNASL